MEKLINGNNWTFSDWNVPNVFRVCHICLDMVEEL